MLYVRKLLEATLFAVGCARSGFTRNVVLCEAYCEMLSSLNVIHVLVEIWAIQKREEQDCCGDRMASCNLLIGFAI